MSESLPFQSLSYTQTFRSVFHKKGSHLTWRDLHVHVHRLPGSVSPNETPEHGWIVFSPQQQLVHLCSYVRSENDRANLVGIVSEKLLRDFLISELHILYALHNQKDTKEVDLVCEVFFFLVTFYCTHLRKRHFWDLLPGGARRRGSPPPCTAVADTRSATAASSHGRRQRCFG